jgi:plasmid maintenance system antidote protein VapI
VLLEQFMPPAGVTGEAAITLARRFCTSAAVWMNLQTAHDLAPARAGEHDPV